MLEYKVKLPAKAVKFIQERTRDFSLYERRGGAKEEDLLVGVYAELAVYEYLREHGVNVGKPDFMLHKKKSFGADLVDDIGQKFHVKGQSKTSSERYGNSWLFQRSDRIVKNQKTIKNEWVICCSVDVDKGIVNILLEKPVRSCKFGDCRLAWFRESKVALYLEDNQ